MFTYSSIQVLHTFTIIAFVRATLKLTNDTRSKIFVNVMFDLKGVTKSCYNKQ